MNKYSDINYFGFLSFISVFISVVIAEIGDMYLPLVCIVCFIISFICSLFLENKSKDKIKKEKQTLIRDDYNKLNQLGDTSHDIYLYLRALKLAETILLHPNNDIDSFVPFEQLLADTIDEKDKRIVVCIGSGGERWGTSQIHFDDNWQKEIIPFFKKAVAIISMPSCTEPCLEESMLICNTPNLLCKTVFVIPPLSCYQPTPGQCHCLKILVNFLMML